jgi:methylenetetrahydrofolate dehydrogenase (NADP+) / methenyltetrahydrofolate cyclohydrolase
MAHQISGSSIFKDVKSRIQKVLDDNPSIHERLASKKVVIIQFQPPIDLRDNYRIGQHNAAITSTAQKQKLFKEFLGCQFEHVVLEPNSTFEECREIIDRANRDNNVRAIIIQHPIIDKLNSIDEEFKDFQIVKLIDPSKDIDAMNKLENQLDARRCATSEAIIRVLDAAIPPDTIERDSAPEFRATIIGSKGFVGKDVESYLKSKGVDVEGIDTILNNTQKIDDLQSNPPNAIVSAAGVANLLDQRHISPSNHIVVDCTFVEGGFNAQGKKIIYGGVNKEAYNIPEFITPVPGGIGPMEMAILLERFIQQEFPELELKSWQLTKLEDLTDRQLETGDYLTLDSLQSQPQLTSKQKYIKSLTDALDRPITDSPERQRRLTPKQEEYFKTLTNEPKEPKSTNKDIERLREDPTNGVTIDDSDKNSSSDRNDLNI